MVLPFKIYAHLITWKMASNYIILVMRNSLQICQKMSFKFSQYILVCLLFRDSTTYFFSLCFDSMPLYTDHILLLLRDIYLFMDLHLFFLRLSKSTLLIEDELQFSKTQRFCCLWWWWIQMWTSYKHEY